MHLVGGGEAAGRALGAPPAEERLSWLLSEDGAPGPELPAPRHGGHQGARLLGGTKAYERAVAPWLK